MNVTLREIKDNLLHKWWFDRHNRSVFEKILWVPVKICNHLPFPFNKYFIKIIDRIGLLIFRFFHVLSTLFSPYYLLEGIEKQSTKKIKILYKGNPSSFKFITNRVYQNSYKIKRLSKRQGKKICKKKENNYKEKPDVFIIKSDMFYQSYLQKKGHIIIPEYVTFLLDTTRSIEHIINNVSIDTQKDIKKAQHTNYSFEVHSDRETFDFFYFQMYLPYTQWKHKKSDRIASYATIIHLQAQGAELLIIKNDKDYIFGGIFHKVKNIMRTYYAGLKKNKFSHLHNGIMALSYYYLITIAKKRNCKFIDFGTSQPFIDDGLYKYKKKWNMEIVQSSPYSSDIFAIKIIHNQFIFDKFITHHPVHYFDNQKIRLLKKNINYSKES